MPSPARTDRIQRGVNMLDSLFFALFGLAVFVCALTALDKEEIAWPILSFPIWIVLAVCVGSIEKASSFMQTDNTIVDHIAQYTGGTFLTILFLGMALVFVMIMYNRVREMWVREVK